MAEGKWNLIKNSIESSRAPEDAELKNSIGPNGAPEGFYDAEAAENPSRTGGRRAEDAELKRKEWI